MIGGTKQIKDRFH